MKFYDGIRPGESEANEASKFKLDLLPPSSAL